MLRCLAFAAFAALSLCTPVQAATTCYTPGFVSLADQTVTARMTAPSGKRCGIGLGSSDGTVLATRISQNARNGSAVTSRTTVSYVSRNGFVGKDVFAYQRDLIDRWGKKVTKTVIVEVTVER